MEIINPAAEKYVQLHSSATNVLLQEIHDYTHQYHPEPHMLSGPVQGKFLSMVSRMIKPKRILEIGTLTGYSSLCLAEGLDPMGVLHTIELRSEDASIAQQFFDKSPFKQQIHLHVGNAHEIIPQLKEKWDLIFVDAEKTGYINYYDTLINMIQPGIFLLFDNVLFHGEVLQAPIKGKSAMAIQRFNEHIQKEERVDKVMLSVRDGIMIIQKLF
ncbi:MAG: O-methyltransferase [Bacteroidota bacterium]